MTAKILVVDGSKAIQQIVANSFEDEDVIVERVGNGDEALARLKRFQPDIVLADTEMQGLNGFELSWEIKESSELKKIPVLLLASALEELDEYLFRASLADDHITKPFKSEDLVQKVRKLLGNDTAALADEDPEVVIELSLANRLNEDAVINLGKNQLLDVGALPDKQEVDLDLSYYHELTLDLDDQEDGQQVGSTCGDEGEKVFPNRPLDEYFMVEVTAPTDDQAEKETINLEENEQSLAALLMKVEELSIKSEEILGNGAPKEPSRMEAIDAILEEVNALKGETFFIAPEEESNYSKITEPLLSPDSTDDSTKTDTFLSEVEYISEENAEALETAFDKIVNEGKNPTFPMEPSDNQESICHQDAVATAADNLSRDFAAPSSSTSYKIPFPDLKKESSPSKGNIIALGASEEIINTNVASQLPPEGQLNPMLEIEVRRIIQQSLTSLLAQEVSRFSEKIIQALEANVQKITPDIARQIIKKEIDKIKNIEDGDNGNPS